MPFRGKVAKLQLWESSGNSQYQDIVRSYIRGSRLLVLVYDVTRRETFQAVTDKWLPAVRAHSTRNVHLCLIGNKVDLDSQRQVTTQEGKVSSSAFYFFLLSSSAAFPSIPPSLLHLRLQQLAVREGMHFFEVDVQNQRLVDQAMNGCVHATLTAEGGFEGTKKTVLALSSFYFEQMALWSLVVFFFFTSSSGFE